MSRPRRRSRRGSPCRGRQGWFSKSLSVWPRSSTCLLHLSSWLIGFLRVMHVVIMDVILSSRDTITTTLVWSQCAVKDWAPDHPKAKLMARKRAAIVDAAREAFVRDGYGGASMERIAKDAGVSIMTLYRHAEGKDDLFSAVIAQ